MSQENHLAREMLVDLEIKRKANLFDEAGILFKDFGGFIDTGGNKSPHQKSGGKKGNIIAQIFMKQATIDLSHRDDKNQQRQADPPGTDYGATITLFDLDFGKLQPNTMMLGGSPKILKGKDYLFHGSGPIIEK